MSDIERKVTRSERVSTGKRTSFNYEVHIVAQLGSAVRERARNSCRVNNSRHAKQ
jgi:hypothetical protein